MNNLCPTCKTESQEILLRSGEVVCGNCLLNKEKEILEIGKEVDSIVSEKIPRNFWDNCLIFILLVFAIGIIILLFVNIVIAVGCIILCLAITKKLKNKSEKANEPLRKDIESRLNNLKDKQETLRGFLRKIYEQFWDLPPDWEWRRQQKIKMANGVCEGEACNRRRWGSVVPFQVHHKIPKSKKDGNHSFSNLQLLCEICHSKMPGVGHELIKESRRKRLKVRKHKKRTGFSPFSRQIAEHLASDSMRYENLKNYLLNRNHKT
jgi:hypothetical protein